MRTKISFCLFALVLSLVSFSAGLHFSKISTADPLIAMGQNENLNPSKINLPAGKVVIAHAGGGVGEFTYTNSREALDGAVANGFKFIELDFKRAKNGDFVLLHRKPTDTLKTPITYDELPNSAAEFVKTKMAGGLTPMSLETLLDWMAENPDVYIVTDLKKDVIEGLREIKARSKDKSERFIAQIYSLDQYDDVKALGYNNIILTVYMLGKPLDISVEDLGDFCRKTDLLALTMPDSWFSNDTFERLGEVETPLFLHTTNGYERASQFLSAGVKGLYTAYITPGWIEQNKSNFDKNPNN